MRFLASGNLFKYEIIIEKGALQNLFNYIDKTKKIFFVIDSKIDTNCFKKYLNDNSYLYYIDANENNKTLEKPLVILNLLFKAGFTKDDLIVSIGGGITSDITGFVASLFKRGIKWINIPTTTLAMLDATVGGKTGVNYYESKNQLGTIYFPSLVIIDVDTLKTLDKRNYNNGLCEAFKMGLTLDKSILDIFNKDTLNLELLIKKCLKAKNKIVRQDINDTSLRHVLNFGHTFGHAFEMNSKGELLHGEAVMNGTLVLSDEKVKPLILSFMNKYQIPVVKNVPFENLVSYLNLDKKANEQGINVTYLNDIEDYSFLNLKIEDLKEIYERSTNK